MMSANRRQFISTGLAAGAALTLPQSSYARNANEEIRVGFISCGGRAGGLMGSFNNVPGVVVAGLCDPDEERLGKAKQRFSGAKTWKDLRGMLDDDQIDAVVIATCNHWHCLAAIWAMEAGKDVYVEKPLSHTQWEGQQTVAAARKYNRICQLGTQQRSDPMQAEIKKFLHEDKTLGEIKAARVNRFGVRPSIGKRTEPLPPPSGVDYDLWLGPAQKQPLLRNALHYDWHWDWNTGSGEMGNWGVHVLDDLRNNVFRDEVTLPRRIFGGGGRVIWNDAGNTPNLHFVYFDTGTIPVVIGLANIVGKPDTKGSPKHPGPGSGYIAYCEGGRLEGQRGGAVAYDSEGKQVRRFRGDSGRSHQANFIDAVRKRDSAILNAHVKVGHDSTGWCNLANVAVQAGGKFSINDARSAVDVEIWQELLNEMEGTMKAHGIQESHALKLSPMLEFDPAKEQFVGDHANEANRFLKREYRKGFEVKQVS
ncbi:MAG: Gfo/Idh/MocA family oxidoreductase [Planctomycetales bacterium]|nr:Gfo/Idh/MocA family oxidoreductase [Planctomycetales bacterium]